MNRVLFFISAVCCSLVAGAQQGGKQLTLQQCIETAVQNNIEVKQSGLEVQAAGVTYSQSKTNRLPTVNGSVIHGVNQGRSIDPFTNSYVNQTINYASYGLGSDVVLFNGLNLKNTVRQNAYAYNASKMDLQQTKDNLTLQVILAYLQVLNNEDQLELARKQTAVTQQQVERLEILNKQGAISPPQLYDLKGQQKDGELNIVTAKNTLETSKLNLLQLMNLPYDASIKLERVGMEELLSRYESTADDIYQAALEQLALVQAAELRTKSAEAAIKATKGLYAPTLFLNGNVNSNYSSIATRDVLVNSVEVPTSNYVELNGSKIPVMTKQPNFTTQKIGYSDQLKNNFFSNVAVGVRIPIFNSLQTKNRVKLATIKYKNQELVEENTKLQLRQEIDQAYLNMNNAWERYKVLLEQVAAYAESFRAAEVRFNAGVGTSVDYLIAKNNADRASANLIMAQYDYLLRKKVLDYYKGIR